MNSVINERFLRLFNLWMLPIVVSWSLMNGVSFFLPNAPEQSLRETSEPFFEIFNISHKFALADTNVASTSYKSVTTETLVPEMHRVSAIVIAGNNSFISIADAKESSVVQLNGRYKKVFRLTRVNPHDVIFTGYGKSYKLLLGMDGNLSRKELITHNIPIENSQNGTSSEWLSIPQKTLDSQLRNIQDVWKKIQLSAVRQEGKINGFRVDSIDQSSVFGRLGLQHGDVIKAVNNQQLESFTDAFSAYATASKQKSIRITVLRNNQKKDIVYEITR